LNEIKVVEAYIPGILDCAEAQFRARAEELLDYSKNRGLGLETYRAALKKAVTVVLERALSSRKLRNPDPQGPPGFCTRSLPPEIGPLLWLPHVKAPVRAALEKRLRHLLDYWVSVFPSRSDAAPSPITIVEAPAGQAPAARVATAAAAEAADVAGAVHGPLTADQEMADRKKLRDEYKAACKAASVRVSEASLAHQIFPGWNDRSILNKWIHLHPRYNGEIDRRIREFLSRRPTAAHPAKNP
jgi:hypothetical protein